MRFIGLLIIFAALATPSYWFATLAAKRDPLAAFSQYLGAAALITMGISQFLATRLKGIEFVFGGLDRIYVLHKWLGVGAMAAILLHDTIDADMDDIGPETFLTDFAETLGEISLYSFLVLVTISVATFVPYHLWRFTHKFIGGFFVLAAIHFMFILKPFSLSDPQGLYVLGFCALGIMSYIYTLFPYGLLRGRSTYKVEKLEESGEALAVSLGPLRRAIRHRAGQFAFVSFDAPGLGEVHPFTISKAPDDRRSIRFSIKPLGDYTKRLRTSLSQGVTARVSGPYGHFRSGGGETAQVWIAAGIGITPFLAWAGSLDETAAPVDLFYCLRSRETAAHLGELQEIAAAKAKFHLHVIESGKAGRLTAEQIIETVASPTEKLLVSFCGPQEMREDLRLGLTSRGLPASRFHFEEFEIRSGLGLRRVASWAKRKLFKR